ncbi:hypothetical protein AAT19DRAFT_12073 [Rhodotorula toruloides]|uniref:Uncharacterized protein n=1 Tax=Rhodotorula toruloides TaxID=5286 RepID=A0A2T0AF77_RHOTO|nr:hypothetical protein AAT19DRAFT_12073 [Rhodotorula toruloides]
MNGVWRSRAQLEQFSASTRVVRARKQRLGGRQRRERSGPSHPRDVMPTCVSQKRRNATCESVTSAICELQSRCRERSNERRPAKESRGIHRGDVVDMERKDRRRASWQSREGGIVRPRGIALHPSPRAARRLRR